MSQSEAMGLDDEEKESDNPSTDTEESLSQYLVPKQKRVSTPVSILIESLVRNICRIYETDQDKSARIYKTICDKLFSMNFIDESYKMKEFEGMRSQYEQAFLQHFTSLKNNETVPLKPVWPSGDVNSHYLREYDEIEYIAGGGFGQVYKVKHKLDGTEYAIKKIPIRTEGIDSVRNYLSEVKTFASLNHSNIVQYKAAWLEIGTPTPKKKAIEGRFERKNSKTNINNNNKEHSEYIYHKDSTQSFTTENYEESTDFEIDFEHSISGANSKRRISQKKPKTKRHSVSEGGETDSKLDLKEIERIRVVQKTKIKWATLFIQMSLCQSTLKQWLDKRNNFTNSDKAVVYVNDHVIKKNTINQILLQLLKGLEYIHSKGIVHHDIKPSNIFIQVENNSILIQLGDFGLACPLQSVRHSLAFGTKLYAAPEQLAGKCNPKSDMYSLGIVLYELVEDFRTDMERVQNITELRKGHIPPNVLNKYPELAHTIGKLVVKFPAKRPDTTALLSSLRSTESEQIERLKGQLAERDEEILHLKELLKSHGIKNL